MNNPIKPRKKHHYRSQVSRQLLIRYLLSLIAWAFGVALFALFCWTFVRSFTWYGDEFLYPFLHWAGDSILFVYGLAVIIGWIFLSNYFLSKPMRYLDELVAAAEQLASPGDEPISLPDTMSDVETQLNLVREQALRSAMAAKEAEQRKNDLIVYLAHDLKTPLTSVIGYLSLLRDEPQISPELRAKYTGIALDKAERLEELINEFFEITRFNLSHLELEREPIDLTRMLQQVISEFEPMLREKGLSCQADLPPWLEYTCDPDKLARVFDNLLRNAVHYSFRDSVIRISMKLETQRVVIVFENMGKTIPPEKLGRIFEQFFRLDSARGTQTGGAGLGLAIAKEIVELHGGTIEAASADSRITFRITLPLP